MTSRDFPIDIQTRRWLLPAAALVLAGVAAVGCSQPTTTTRTTTTEQSSSTTALPATTPPTTTVTISKTQQTSP
jgi:hypothetical protein